MLTQALGHRKPMEQTVALRSAHDRLDQDLHLEPYQLSRSPTHEDRIGRYLLFVKSQLVNWWSNGQTLKRAIRAGSGVPRGSLANVRNDEA